MNPAIERRDLREDEVIAAPCSLWVPHLAADGKRSVKMVGQVVRHRDDLVFHHAHSGTQFHRKYDCPAPVDLRVVTLLHRSGIFLVYVFDRKRGELWRTDLDRLRNAHIAFYDGRNRLYLPRSGWDRRAGLIERQEGAQRVYVGTRRRDDGSLVEGEPLMRIPFLPLELVIRDPGGR